MDSAADSLLALSNTAAAFAVESEPEDDDDRSSSLSELDDEAADDFAEEPLTTDPVVEADSEAETERLDESPDKLQRTKSFGATPSKLAQSVHVDERPEIESLTDSGISSPISSHDDSDDLSEVPANDDEPAEEQFVLRSPGKRKREDDEEQDEEEQERTRRRRTGSIASDDPKSDDSDDDEPSPPSREATMEREAEPEAVEEEAEDEDDDQADEDKADSNEDAPGQPRKIARPIRRRGKDGIMIDAEQEVEEDAEAAEESDEAEVDDAEAATKSEEEQARKVAAMESLLALERHFATLRDRLYDERIAAINQELAQLSEPVPSHPELLKQLEVVKRYRDEKFEIEQKLLVYKVGALKNKSMGERSQLHSAYFQTVRDIREKHLERLSEHFYRIQRDRFKTESATPSFTIPFPEKRSKQITQQTAYNKEVSITSGVAKYVGFPAAPEIPQAHARELEEDLQKMGVSGSRDVGFQSANRSQLSTQIRNARPVQRVTSGYSSALAGAIAEEQFLEKNPWANPQHPMHRLAISRQNSNRSPTTDTYLTPAQQRTADQPQIGGSASTIPEHPSAQASSAWNTPHENVGSHTKHEAQSAVNQLNSVSTLDTRRAPPAPADLNHHEPEPRAQDTNMENASSPLGGRVTMAMSPSRAVLGLADGLGQRSNASPSQRPPGIAAGGGYAGMGRLGLF